MSERDFPDFQPVAAAAPSAAQAAGKGGIGFHDVLSALNPLQYLPVVGNIYRALTGDTISEPLRIAGSMIVSGLTGGPIGALASAAGTALQKIAGIDFDRVAHDVFAAIELIHDAAPATPTAMAQSTATEPKPRQDSVIAAPAANDAALRWAAGRAYAQAASLNPIHETA